MNNGLIITYRPVQPLSFYHRQKRFGDLWDQGFDPSVLHLPPSLLHYICIYSNTHFYVPALIEEADSPTYTCSTHNSVSVYGAPIIKGLQSHTKTHDITFFPWWICSAVSFSAGCISPVPEEQQQCLIWFAAKYIGTEKPSPLLCKNNWRETWRVGTYPLQQSQNETYKLLAEGHKYEQAPADIP